MSELSFDDLCTGANPRYPLIREIKQMFINVLDKPVIEKESVVTEK